MTLKVARCHIRFVQSSDYLRLEEIYLGHEGDAIPAGYFEEFRETIRSEEVFYLVAERDGVIVGGGGIFGYVPGSQASFTFGVVEKKECGKGYGTALILARLRFIDPGREGCQICLQATERSADFFGRLGFTWYDCEEDEAGNRFVFGAQMVSAGSREVFSRLLTSGEVTLADDIRR